MKILLTSCTLNSSLFVLRSLVRNGHEVIAVDYRRLPMGLRSRFVTHFELVPHEYEAKFADELLRVVAKFSPDVVLPITGSESISKEYEKFKAVTNILVPSYKSFLAVNDKKNILKQCQKFEIPHSVLINNCEIAEEKLSSKTINAIVIKPCKNLGGGSGIRIVSDASRVRQIYNEVESIYGECMVCEYVPGPDSNNFALHVVFDRNSQPVCQFAFQKVRLNPAKTGVTAVAATKRIPELLRIVLPMLRQLKWRGPADIEFKMDSKDQQLKLIEINARFSGAVGYAISCGIDFPEITCNAALGHSLPPIDENAYQEGIKYWNPIHYCKSVYAELRQSSSRMAMLRRAVKEIKGHRVGNPYDISDPAPAIGKFLYSFTKKNT